MRHRNLSHDAQVMRNGVEVGVNSQSLGEMTQHFGIVGSLDGAHAAQSDGRARPVNERTAAVGVNVFDNEVGSAFVRYREGGGARAVPKQRA